MAFVHFEGSAAFPHNVPKVNQYESLLGAMAIAEPPGTLDFLIDLLSEVY